MAIDTTKEEITFADQRGMRAYHGSEEDKEQFLSILRRHRDQDDLIQGTYWQGNGEGKGCAVGCGLDTWRRIEGLPQIDHGDHGLYASLMGMPEQLAHLEDRIFEGLSAAEAKGWPVRFGASIPVGADLSMVWPQYAVWLLTDPRWGVLRYAEGYPKSSAAIERVAALYKRVVAGEEVLKQEFRDAAYAAYADAATADAADADAATADAYAAADAATADAATRRRHYAAQANKLVELLTAAPVPEASAA